MESKVSILSEAIMCTLMSPFSAHGIQKQKFSSSAKSATLNHFLVLRIIGITSIWTSGSEKYVM